MSDQAKEALYNKLRESGQIEVIQAHLREKLLESSWKSAVSDRCDEYINRHGIEKTNIDDLSKDVMPVAQASVPEEIKVLGFWKIFEKKTFA